MLEQILNLVQGTVKNVINNNNSVPEEKKELAINTTTHAITDSLEQHFTPDNISQLSNLFSGNKASGSNFLVNSIQSTIVNVLSNKIGLSPNIASSIASSIIPTLINTLSGKINDPNEKEINLESIIGMFSGKNNNHSGDIGGSLISSLGKIFGK